MLNKNTTTATHLGQKLNKHERQSMLMISAFTIWLLFFVYLGCSMIWSLTEIGANTEVRSTRTLLEDDARQVEITKCKAKVAELGLSDKETDYCQIPEKNWKVTDSNFLWDTKWGTDDFRKINELTVSCTDITDCDGSCTLVIKKADDEVIFEQTLEQTKTNTKFDEVSYKDMETLKGKEGVMRVAKLTLEKEGMLEKDVQIIDPEKGEPKMTKLMEYFQYKPVCTMRKTIMNCDAECVSQIQGSRAALEELLNKNKEMADGSVGMRIARLMWSVKTSAQWGLMHGNAGGVSDLILALKDHIKAKNCIPESETEKQLREMTNALLKASTIAFATGVGFMVLCPHCGFAVGHSVTMHHAVTHVVSNAGAHATAATGAALTGAVAGTHSIAAILSKTSMVLWSLEAIPALAEVIVAMVQTDEDLKNAQMKEHDALGNVWSTLDAVGECYDENEPKNENDLGSKKMSDCLEAKSKNYENGVCASD